MGIIKKGDHVRVSFEGREVDANVVMASPNGVSLVLEFDCGLGGLDGMYLGLMPVLLHKDGVFRDLFSGRVVTLEFPARAQTGAGK